MNDPSNSPPTIDLVCEMILETMAENGIDAIPLSPDTRILQDTPLDSMGLAVVVLKLEERTGLDPFNEGFVMFQTVSELAQLYEN
jgi:acyl carrier protein